MPKPKSTRVGIVATSSSGMKMTCIAYRNAHDIDIQFEDGTISKNKAWDNFRKGRIAHPRGQNVGTVSIATNGVKMTCIVYRGHKDIDVRFEDGTIVEHKSWTDFQKGYVAHPQINQHYRGKLNGVDLRGVIWRSGEKVYYCCHCPKCNRSDILTPQEILLHVCEKKNVNNRHHANAENRTF